MVSIVLEEKLSIKESEAFSKEFPKFTPLVIPNLESFLSKMDTLTKHSIQIYVGDNFPWEIAKEFPQLKWVHTHSSHPPIHSAPLIITSSLQVHAFEISELLWSAFHLFSMKLLEIKGNTLDPGQKIWSRRDKTFLQIGLGATGSKLATIAKNNHMKTWGIQPTGSYHPACSKTFSPLSLHALLPFSNVVSISPHQGGAKLEPFDEHAINLIKDDSILIIGGTSINDVISEKTFKKINWSRFRGLVTYSPADISSKYLDMLKKLPNACIIPSSITEHLETKTSDAYRQLRNNLRAFTRNDMMSMQGIIQKGPLKERFHV